MAATFENKVRRVTNLIDPWDTGRNSLVLLGKAFPLPYATLALVERHEVNEIDL